MKFKVMEVGSTNTKTYLYDGKIFDLEMRTIEFKNNYKKNKMIVESDKENLFSFVQEMKEDHLPVFVFGTSIFRNLSEKETEEWLKEFKEKTNIDFEIVSAEKENVYTTLGAIAKIPSKINVAVMIGGGGSTELSILKNKENLAEYNLNYGAMDVTDQFPELREDYAVKSIEEMMDWTIEKSNVKTLSTDILILAGGNYLKFYNELNYQLKPNSYYQDEEAPFMMSKEEMKQFDEDFFYHQSLMEIKKTSSTPDWWSGTRGMRICVNAICNLVNASVIIPTKISMIYGIVEKILKENK